MISHPSYEKNWEFLPTARGGAPIFLSEWLSRRLRRRYNSNKITQMNVRAPKAPPMMGPIGSFGVVFPCTNSVAGLVGVAPDVELNEPEEDSNVENGEKDSVEYDEGDNTGECGVVDGVVVVELGNEMVRGDEGSLGRVSSLTIKKSRDIASFVFESSAYSIVNTWEVLGRSGDWKNRSPHFVVAVRSDVSLTGVPSSIV
jgi:hypothetical protein